MAEMVEERVKVPPEDEGEGGGGDGEGEPGEAEDPQEACEEDHLPVGHLPGKLPGLHLPGGHQPTQGPPPSSE